MSRQHKTILQRLETYCAENNLRLTNPRLYVLEIISSSRTPLGAYEILAMLRNKLDNPKPPTAYRAIEFLKEHGFIHRIESLNSYISCQSDHKHDGSQFMICDTCGKVIETHLCHLPDDFQNNVANANFTPEKWNLEIHGICARCQ